MNGTVRRMLMGTLAVGMLGTAGELLLLGHFESVWQWTPLVLLGAGLVVVTWQVVAPRPSSVRALQVLMALFVTGSLVGVGLHYSGNEEFELEMYPSMGGLGLVRETLTGATPVLAPGALGLLGLVGLVYTYAHPSALDGRGSGVQEERE